MSDERVAKVTDVQIATLAVEVARSAAPVFAAKDWRWNPGGSTPHVPEEREIAEAIQHLCHNAQSSPEESAYSATGRFQVCREIDNGLEGEVETLSVSLELGEVSGKEPAHA